ncbi:MAG: methyltransferase domain-containing protein [Muribaculaceae bacterium]|nr:methyltransferase domain-containing protein [Muribaculaceae bacterium]
MNTQVLDARHDPMGAAIADFYKNGIAGRLRVLSSMFDEDEIPVAHLFREEDEMGELELKALGLSKGRILDVGAGAGCHALALQDKGMSVTAIDVSPLSVEVMAKSGVDDARLVNLYDDALCEKFDTILMLMNGSGIIGKIANMPQFFARIDSLLAEGGQVLMDSSDLIYLFEDEEGGVDIDLAGDYYGEVDFAMQYKNIKGEPFDWLYIDFETLAFHAAENGFVAELVAEGEHYDYLARITRK